MESIKLSVQTDHTFLTQASIFCHCITNVKTLILFICSPTAPGSRFVWGGGGAEPRRILLQTLKRLSATRPKAQDSFCKHIRVTLFLWTQSPVRVDGAVKSIPVMPNELCSLGPLGRELRTSTLQFIDACLLKIVSDCETQHRKHEVT